MSIDNLSSRLNRRITFEYPMETPDGSGGFTTLWSEFEAVWAEVTPLSTSYGHELFADAQVQSQVMHRFIIRDLSGITADMRISYSGRYFNIRAIRHPDARRAMLEIIAEEGVAV